KLKEDDEFQMGRMRQPERELSQSYFPQDRVEKATFSSLALQNIVGAPQGIEFGALLAQLLDFGADLLIAQDGLAITTKFGDQALRTQRPFRDEISRLRGQKHVLQQIR